MLALGKGQRSALHGYALGEKDCDKLRKRKWLGDNNQYVFVPVGGFTDPHHSICYRIFNIDREVIAHKVAPAKVDLPSHDDQTWKALQQDAKVKSSEFLTDDSSDAKFPGATKAVKEHGKLSCLFDAPHSH